MTFSRVCPIFSSTATRLRSGNLSVINSLTRPSVIISANWDNCLAFYCTAILTTLTPNSITKIFEENVLKLTGALGEKGLNFIVIEQ